MTLFISSIVSASSDSSELANIAADLPIRPKPEQGLDSDSVEGAIHELSADKQSVVLTQEDW